MTKEEYHKKIEALDKEQFFQYGLNTEHLTNDYIINVYKQIKKR